MQDSRIFLFDFRIVCRSHVSNVSGGDLTPPNGKVDAQDLSYIIKNLGKVTTDATQNTDLNGDGITDVVDYSLAFYSLSNNAEDDKIELTAPIQPTVTPSVIPSLSPTDPTHTDGFSLSHPISHYRPDYNCHRNTNGNPFCNHYSNPR